MAPSFRHWLIAALLVAPAAVAETRWFQVPAHPVWLDLPAGWKAAADGKEPMLVAQGARGGTLFLLVAPTDEVKPALGRLQRRLEAEWREAAVTLSDAGRLSGTGRLGETRFAIDSRSRVLDTSGVSGVHRSLTLVVVSGLPKAVKVDLDALVGAARVRWEQPGGGWVAVPGAGVEVQVPVDGWRTVVNGDVLALKSLVGRSEVQLRVLVDDTPAAVVEQHRKGLDYPFLAWDGAPKKWAAPKGVGAGGLELSATGDHEGARFRAVVRAAVLPATGPGPARVLVILATSEGAVDPAAAGATLPAPLSVAELLAVSGALRLAP